jgi:hypothetical protein
MVRLLATWDGLLTGRRIASGAQRVCADRRAGAAVDVSFKAHGPGPFVMDVVTVRC